MPTGWKFWRGEEVKARVLAAQREALRTVGRDMILPDAKSEVPELTGALRDSGKAVMSRSKEPRIRILFRGPYAVRWHEKQARFRGGRKRFYLRDPFNRHVGRVPHELRREYAKRLR